VRDQRIRKDLTFPVNKFANASMDALLTGKLLRQADCLVVVGKGGRGYALPIWPQGFSHRNEETGVTVLNETGKVVARSGERISMSGGLVGETPASLPANWEDQVGTCEGPYWLVRTLGSKARPSGG
jgi:hypothetical protein